jgi:hypothetical protein
MIYIFKRRKTGVVPLVSICPRWNSHLKIYQIQQWFVTRGETMIFLLKLPRTAGKSFFLGRREMNNVTKVVIRL